MSLISHFTYGKFEERVVINMSKLPISVCIIAKNEERYIEECLKRLKPYGFEIIVTDTGSTDKTKEIAAKYADKVLDFEWINDFSAARNFCAANASNNWILSLDCDEYVNSLDVSTLRIFMQKFPKCTGIIRLKSIVTKPNGEKGFSSDDIIRMYNRSYYLYEEPIHEQIVDKKIENRSKTQESFVIPSEIVHWGYDISPEQMRLKQQRNLDILHALLEKKPDDPYTLFQIGQSEYILDEYEKSKEYYEKALSYNPSTECLYVQIMIESLAKNYIKLGMNDEAISLMETYADKCKAAKYVYIHACVLMDCGQRLKALLYFVKATMMNDVNTLGDELLKCYEYIIMIYLEMGDEKMAGIFKDKYEACVKERERLCQSFQ